MKEQIILGSLLGDATIAKLSGRGKIYSIRWEHSLKQEDYALWKAENSLDNYSIYRRSRLDKRTDNTYHSITCYSTKDNYQYFRELFYKDKKEVSEEILNKLEPLGIAVWFMDDGNLYYNGNNCHLTLSVNGFNDESVDRIINYFSVQYDVNFKKIGKAIRLTSKKECLKFMSIVEQYILDCMKYKKLSEAEQKHEQTLNSTQLKMRNSKLELYGKQG